MEKIRCAAFMKAPPYRARGKLLLTWRAAPPKTSICYENSVKNDIFTVLRWFSPPSSGPRGRTPRPDTGCAQGVLQCGCMGQAQRRHLERRYLNKL